MNRNVELEPEATECHCRAVPLSHLGLDLDEPMGGWTPFFRERNIEVVPDDLGRPSVPRQVLGELLAEREEQDARAAAQRAEQAAALRTPVPAGVPPLADATAFESMAAAEAGAFMTPSQEFGRRPAPNFLVEELEAGQRQAAEQRAEAELLKEAQRVLDGRDK